MRPEEHQIKIRILEVEMTVQAKKILEATLKYCLEYSDLQLGDQVHVWSHEDQEIKTSNGYGLMVEQELYIAVVTDVSLAKHKDGFKGSGYRGTEFNYQIQIRKGTSVLTCKLDETMGIRQI